MILTEEKIKKMIRQSLNEAINISMVKQIQLAIGTEPDGDWGPLTDAAWYQWCKENAENIVNAYYYSTDPEFVGPPDLRYVDIIASGNIQDIANSEIGKMIGESNKLKMVLKLTQIPADVQKDPTVLDRLKSIFKKAKDYFSRIFPDDDTPKVEHEYDELELPDLDYTLDKTKLKRYRRVDLDSVHKMSKATGLRPDFVFGLQARESAGDPRAMALNPRISLSFTGKKTPKGYRYARDIPKYKGGVGSEGYMLWKKHAEKATTELSKLGYTTASITGVNKQGFDHPAYKAMKDVDNDLAILGNALGYYQVLGYHLMPKYNYSGASIESAFLADPKKFGQDAFIIWVKKHSRGSNSFKDKCNASEDNWFDQISRYYGQPFPEYVDYVKAAAATYRSAKVPKQGASKEVISKL